MHIQNAKHNINVRMFSSYNVQCTSNYVKNTLYNITG